MKCKIIVIFLILFLAFDLIADGTLFVGLEGSSPSTFSTDMTGFPSVNWTAGFSHDVSGAAATPDGTIYIIEGAFTTHLYSFTLGSTPQQLCTISEDMSALAYGNGTLYGYSNYADPKGIYSIDPNTGTATLVLDVYTGTNYRFFALDFNPEDGLFYGYTEYGTSGLYSINIDTGDMINLTGSIPASNGQGRGMAVGNNTVYLTATRGDDGIGYYAYDISQGVGGTWVEFNNPYPAYHSTGGAAFIPNQNPQIEVSGHVVGSDNPSAGLAGCDVTLTASTVYETQTDANGDFVLEDVYGNTLYSLEISLAGYDTYSSDLQTGDVNIDLNTITLDETATPVTNVQAEVLGNYLISVISWDAPQQAERELESYKVYRFLEVNASVPSFWDLIADNFIETTVADSGWVSLNPDIYQYAVVAVYTNGLESDPAFSNVLEKEEYFYPPFNLHIEHDPLWDYVIFTWEAYSVPGIDGFNIYLDGVYDGFTDDFEYYFFGLENGVAYTAGVEVVYDNGVSDLIDIDFTFTGVGSDNNTLTAKTELNIYPNPFNPSTTISFSLTTEITEDTEISIYNLKGQRVKTFSNHQIFQSPNHQIVWNGTDQNDKPVPSGIYFTKLKSGSVELIKKMVMIK